MYVYIDLFRALLKDRTGKGNVFNIRNDLIYVLFLNEYFPKLRKTEKY